MRQETVVQRAYGKTQLLPLRPEEKFLNFDI